MQHLKLSRSNNIGISILKKFFLRTSAPKYKRLLDIIFYERLHHLDSCDNFTRDIEQSKNT